MSWGTVCTEKEGATASVTQSHRFSDCIVCTSESNVRCDAPTQSAERQSECIYYIKGGTPATCWFSACQWDAARGGAHICAHWTRSVFLCLSLCVCPQMPFAFVVISPQPEDSTRRIIIILLHSRPSTETTKHATTLLDDGDDDGDVRDAQSKPKCEWQKGDWKSLSIRWRGTKAFSGFSDGGSVIWWLYECDRGADNALISINDVTIMPTTYSLTGTQKCMYWMLRNRNRRIHVFLLLIFFILPYFFLWKKHKCIFDFRVYVMSDFFHTFYFCVCLYARTRISFICYFINLLLFWYSIFSVALIRSDSNR